MTNEVFAIAVPTLAVLTGILINNSRLSDLNSRLLDLKSDVNSRISDLKSHMDVRFEATDRRIEDTRDLLRTEFHRVEEVMDARLNRIEQELHLK